VLRHPETTFLPAWLAAKRTTDLAALTHIAVTGQGVRIGTRRGCHTFLRRRFVDASGPEDLAEALGQHLAASPEAKDIFARMRRLDTLSQRRRCPITRGAAIVCVVVFGLQWWFQPALLYAGEFSASLVKAGELWRLVTANLLHGSLGHMALNVMGLRFLGAFVERPLGAHATFLILVLSGFGAMVGSALAGYPSAVGASGMVFGLAGALLWLELGRSEELPVSLRLPRRLLVVLVLAETVLLSFIPMVAGAAHVGGLIAGYFAARVTASGALPATSAWLPRVNAPLAAIVVFAISAAGWWQFAAPEGLVLRRAERLLAIEDIHPIFLNNAAWELATRDAPQESELDAALRLATRAVAETSRQDATILDTLAEVHFVSGRASEALATIDEAIALVPGETYYREQRRRFLGKRAANDRPEGPSIVDP
jgi:membrane associated rhomboid family serine protease